MKSFIIAMAVASSTGAFGALDFNGLLHGQAVTLTETRTTEFAALTGPDQYLEVAGDRAAGLALWTMQGVSRFAGQIADPTERNLPPGPQWEAEEGDAFTDLNGYIKLFPAAEIPEGRWVLTAKLFYRFQRKPGAIGGTRVEIEIGCMIRDPSFGFISTPVGDHERKEHSGSAAWQNGSITVAVNDTLRRCTSTPTQPEWPGNFNLTVRARGFKGFHFQGVALTMARIEPNP